MSRTKKSRRIKGKLNIKTGSKKAFIAPGDKGKIPSQNKLAKHKKNRQKSAYEKFAEIQQESADKKSEHDDSEQE